VIRNRVLLLLAVPLLVLAVPTASIGLFSDDLPDRLATHWSGSTADDSMTLTTLVLFSGVVFVLPGLIISSAGVLASQRLPKGGAAMAVFFGLFLSAMVSLIVTSTVFSQRGLEDWTEASLVGVLPVLLISPLIGAAGSWFARALPGTVALRDRLAALPECQHGHCCVEASARRPAIVPE
jgi:hypothetical protein